MQVTRNLVQKYGPRVAAVATSMYVGFASAAIDAAVSTEMAGAKTDVQDIGKLVFGIALGIALYKWFKRAL